MLNYFTAGYFSSMFFCLFWETTGLWDFFNSERGSTNLSRTLQMLFFLIIYYICNKNLSVSIFFIGCLATYYGLKTSLKTLGFIVN